MPYALVSPPLGRGVVVGASAAEAMVGCGGTLVGARASGAEVSWGMATDPGGAVEGMEWSSQRDGLPRQGEPHRAVDFAFVPHPYAASAGTRAILAEFSGWVREERWSGRVWLYETAIPLWPNRGVDIGGWVQRKEGMLSDVGGGDRISAARGLARYRGLRPVVDFAEGFLVMSAARFLAEVQRLGCD